MSDRINKIRLILSPAELLLGGRDDNTVSRESLDDLSVVCREPWITGHAPHDDSPTVKTVWKLADLDRSALLATSECQAKEDKTRIFHRESVFAQRKGQAQPLAAALATATTVFCRLMLTLLTGAVAVACTVLLGDSLI